MRKQSTAAILMVPPIHFGYNAQTAVTNPFQHKPNDSIETIKKKATTEFRAMVATLQKEGITITILKNPKAFKTPDAVFPNNWFSTHKEILVLYPILSPARRLERQKEKLLEALLQNGITITTIHDLTNDEKKGRI